MNQIKTTKKGFASVFLFYFLVAFEFAYMAGPFAIYFYSVYSPILNFLNRYPKLAWMIQFFLPHAVRDTSSIIINSTETLGAILSITGFLLFLIGACQIYYSKLAKKGAVLGGLYTLVRHPQYTSFIVCSFGLMLLWPRYIVVILFVTLLFAYLLLARAEEKECEEKFGESYLNYEKKTGRFFPKIFYSPSQSERKPLSKGRTICTYIAAYLLTMAFFLLCAAGLRSLTLNSLYAIYDTNSVTVSICELSDSTMTEIIEIAKADKGVMKHLETYTDERPELNYILPTEWYAAEIPMNGIQYRRGHSASKSYDHNLYKIILTKATLREDCQGGKEILKKTMSMEPIVEVWVDLDSRKVINILEMPEDIKYDGIPEAIY